MFHKTGGGGVSLVTASRARKAVAEAFRNEIKTDARLSQGRTPDSRQSSMKRLNCAE